MGADGGRFPLRWAWLIPAAGVLTLVLGLWGWLDHRYEFDDALYRTLALFEIDNDAYTQGVGLADWRFRIGRWTGAATVFSSLLAVAALLREHLAAALARWSRQQVVVVGEGELALCGYEAAVGRRMSAVWLGAPVFSSERLSTIALAWPAGERAAAVFQHVRGAEQVLIAVSDDAEALGLTRAARSAAPGAWLTVVMREARLAENAAATLNDARTRVLSVPGLAARALMLRRPPFLIARDRGQRRVHSLILGFGQTGQAIARELIINGRTTYLEAPRITVVDPEAEALEAAFRVRAPELDRCAEMAFVAGEVSSRAVRPSPAAFAATLHAGGPLTAAYVCLGADTEALSAAVMLTSLLRAAEIAEPPLFVRLAGGGLTGEGGEGLERLTPFGETRTLLAATEFLSQAPDAAARAFAEAYRASLPQEVRDDPKNRSALPWEQLEETYRQANREAVAHIAAKIASAGLTPAPQPDTASLPRLPQGKALFETDAELEALAELEHERWIAQRRMDGWRGVDGPRDDARRMHPSLRPYGELTEAVKAYDRLIVRQSAIACAPDEGEAAARRTPRPLAARRGGG